MSFHPYQHIERLGTDEVEGICESGIIYVTPKLDGTNGCIWWEDGEICCGSRKRKLGPGSDNAGFFFKFNADERFKQFFDVPENRQFTLYGEYLVSNHVKYTADAYGEFYVFDVVDDTGEYVPQLYWQRLLEIYNIAYIPIIATFKCPVTDIFERVNEIMAMEPSNLFVVDGMKGEGVVLKNYSYQNKWGRRTWAKVVREEYQQNKSVKKVKTLPEGAGELERAIAEEFITRELCLKTKDKIALEEGGWSSRLIGKLLGIIWHEFVIENSWEVIKRFKSPTVNYNLMQKAVTSRVKEVLPEVF